MRKVVRGCETALRYGALLSTFIIMCLTTADAAGRYLLNSPITGAYEITTSYLMVAMVFLAATSAYREGAYIRVTFLVDRLSRRTRVVVDYCAQVVSILYGLVLVIATILQSLRAAETPTTLSSVTLPLAPAYMIVPAGLFFMSLALLLDLRRVRSGASSLLKQTSPADLAE